MESFSEIWPMKKILFCAIVILLNSFIVSGQVFNNNAKKGESNADVITGADRMHVYLPFLRGKAVAVFANATSMVGKMHLVDTLLRSGVKVVKIFGPEHGFRGDVQDGQKINSELDTKTGIPVISLYGDHKKPTKEELQNVDLLVYDIQDVGVRCYTFISSFQYYLEAALENHKPLLILDRPNPNGFYVDGPVLEPKFKSFIGMQPIPIVYGMTIGEYALMLAGEKWLSAEANAINAYNITTRATSDTPFHVQVIKCKNYDHNTKYALPINPSPNLKDMQSIYLYASTFLFEGTALSEGRGTDKPFQYIGHPSLPKTLFSFTPMPNAGSQASKCFGQKCYGWNLGGTVDEVLKSMSNSTGGYHIQLKYIMEAYTMFPKKDSFFLDSGGHTFSAFNKRAGNNKLIKQIRKRTTEDVIRKSWEPALSEFKKIRKKYLLYEDFE